MLKPNRQIWIWLTVFALCAGAAFSKSATDQNGKTYEFKQELEGVVAGTTLKPGVYNIKIAYETAEKGKLTIAKNKQVVAEVLCKIEKSDLNLESNSVAYDRDAQGKRVVRWFFVRDRKEKVELLPDQP